MCCQLDDAVTGSRAEWLLELSERAKANGDRQRAEALLLAAWMAYDGQEVILDGYEARPDADRPHVDAA